MSARRNSIDLTVVLGSSERRQPTTSSAIRERRSRYGSLSTSTTSRPRAALTGFERSARRGPTVSAQYPLITSSSYRTRNVLRRNSRGRMLFACSIRDDRSHSISGGGTRPLTFHVPRPLAPAAGQRTPGGAGGGSGRYRLPGCTARRRRRAGCTGPAVARFFPGARNREAAVLRTMYTP